MMRAPTFLLSATVAVGAMAFAAGCSGSTSPSASTLPKGGTTAQSANRQTRGPVIPDINSNPIDLAITEQSGTGDVVVLDNHFANETIITSGVNVPAGDWYDRNDNLYVANVANGAGNVTEYNPSYGLAFTYSTGLTRPVNVTTDISGNVYVADYGPVGSAPGVVEEFPQGNNTPSASCATGLLNGGIAWDRTAGIFVSGENPNTRTSSILWYRAGLAGCPTPKTLGVTISGPGGLQMDMRDNLLACDTFKGVVDIIPPPYSAVSATIAGATICANIALNVTQNQIYIVDPANGDVLVDQYPSGNHITTLNSVNGISSPAGVAAWRQTAK